MDIFSAADRESIRDFILRRSEKNQDIVSAVLVGSGSVGFADEFSDLDFYMVVDRNENIEKAMADMSAGIEEHLRIIFFQQMPERKLQVFLTENCLEIDVGYATVDEVNASCGRWKVLFDKVGGVEESMGRTWEANAKSNHGKTQGVDGKGIGRQYAQTAWHHLFHAAVAVKRGQLWRGMAEMDAARNMLVGLMGYRYSLVTKRWRDIDSLPEAELTALGKTLVTSLSREAMFDSLMSLTAAIYDEMEAHDAGLPLPVDRYHVREYIQAVRMSCMLNDR